jgi:thioredoxin reductase (NADPH)
VETVVPKEGIFTVRTSKATYRATSVVIATGFYDIPNTMGIPGEDMEKVSHYYREPHFYSHQKLAVIGASNSAIDAALECYRKGAAVSLIIRGPEVGQRVKYWVRPDIINRIGEGSIKAYYNTEVKEIKEGHLVIQNQDGIQELENDYVLALTGYRPNFHFLKTMGINLTEDDKMIPHYDPKTMETNVKGLYLAGVICGGMETHKWFIENSLVHAEMIMASILKKRSR